eukprot:3896037-Pleurochrysis_carterae.AAC.1
MKERVPLNNKDKRNALGRREFGWKVSEKTGTRDEKVLAGLTRNPKACAPFKSARSNVRHPNLCY